MGPLTYSKFVHIGANTTKLADGFQDAHWNIEVRFSFDRQLISSEQADEIIVLYDGVYVTKVLNLVNVNVNEIYVYPCYTKIHYIYILSIYYRSILSFSRLLPVMLNYIFYP